MNYHKINKHDIANGEGIRVSLFVSGCHRHCEECFNQETWNPKSGQPFTRETLEEILEACKPDYISGLSLLGGEPMEPYNQPVLTYLVSEFKQRYPEKDVWCWTGFTFKELFKNSELLTLVDVLVDGAFIKEKKDLTLKWAGSTNQRVIDVKKSIQEGEIHERR